MDRQIGPFKKTTIIGVGLMGGSLALAIRGKTIFGKICGFARSEKTYKRLKKLNILDVVEKDLKAAVSGADIVVIAAPVYAIAGYLKKIAPFLKKGAVVMDLGSTKEYIQKCALRYLPQYVYFVGSHPLCGGEKSGAEFSRADLYKRAYCFIVAGDHRNHGFRTAEMLWRSVGCNLIALTAEEHDKILAFVSHLPHLLSFAMAAQLPGCCYDFIGPAFKDMTRIAASPANVWNDIFLSNKDNVLKSAREFIEALEEFCRLIKEEDTVGISRFIEKANKKVKAIR